jgi:hypothetical protein
MHHLREEYNGSAMRRHRRDAARALLRGTPPGQYQLPEIHVIFEVLNFFEKVGLLVARGDIDEQFVYTDFNYHLYAYWHISRGLVEHARRTQPDPSTLVNMEYLYERVLALDIRETEKYGGVSTRGNYTDAEWQRWAAWRLVMEDANAS